MHARDPGVLMAQSCRRPRCNELRYVNVTCSDVLQIASERYGQPCEGSMLQHVVFVLGTTRALLIVNVE